jgi:hypothetical protein
MVAAKKKAAVKPAVVEAVPEVVVEAAPAARLSVVRTDGPKDAPRQKSVWRS